MAQSLYVNRAFLVADGSATFWLAQFYDPTMAEHPSAPDPADYTGFAVVARAPVVIRNTQAEIMPLSEIGGFPAAYQIDYTERVLIGP